MDSRDEEEHHTNPFLNGGTRGSASVPRLQFRKEVSKARWDDDLRMGEIIEKKGGIWATTGIVRNGGKLYCSLEEILFLAEKGALLLFSAEDTVLTLKDMYVKIAEGKNGCSWESFKAYRRLKSLGYIVGRHGVPWTSKSGMINAVTDFSNSKGITNDEEENGMLVKQFKDLQINEMKPTFDVYLPDSKFRKSSPGNPYFVLCLIRGSPPTRAEVEKIERICNGVPLKLCYVDHWLVSFVSLEKVDLPVLP